MTGNRELADGRYALDAEPIASGGMGTVWRGYDRKLKRAVAIKELRLAEDLGPVELERQRERVIAEARAAARLEHPGIVSVYDVVEEDGRPWLVMRLVAGRSLAEEVTRAGPLAPQRTASLGLRLLEALATAHAQGVLHRDVKPQNVLLDAEGRPVLTDFGIAVVAGVTRPVTEAGLVVGTVGYLAPERLSGGVSGPESDLWSLGATLYYAVEGRHAYDTGDVAGTIAAVLSRDPEPAERAGQLAPLILGLMSRDPAERPDVWSARSHLEAMAAGRPASQATTRLLHRAAAATTPLPTGSAARGAVPPPAPRGRARAAGIAAGVVLLAAGVGLGMYINSPTKPTDHRAAPTNSPTPNRFGSAPKVCESDLLNEARIGEEMLVGPVPGATVSTEAVNHCEWHTDYSGDSLSVNIVRHGNTAQAVKTFRSQYERFEFDAEYHREELGDEAAINDDDALVRISNLTITIRYPDPLHVTLRDLASEVLAAAEADADTA
ncbi:serine/threonine-protein kinase [Streptomyces abyssomicinicus]|uniref:serine/threonine-protein kinase n=1 Tax=Streptomyces abyssomicinicus TaxID=574929 RepID=UPI0012500CD7|nr:serine/threonine-protein kinase [Streptomyces abyssomicinicus]